MPTGPLILWRVTHGHRFTSGPKTPDLGRLTRRTDRHGPILRALDSWTTNHDGRCQSHPSQHHEYHPVDAITRRERQDHGDPPTQRTACGGTPTDTGPQDSSTHPVAIGTLPAASTAQGRSPTRGSDRSPGPNCSCLPAILGGHSLPVRGNHPIGIRGIGRHGLYRPPGAVEPPLRALIRTGRDTDQWGGVGPDGTAMF